MYARKEYATFEKLKKTVKFSFILWEPAEKIEGPRLLLEVFPLMKSDLKSLDFVINIFYEAS